MPRWWTRINERVFNPLELRRGDRPVLTHVGRISGATYRTPLDAHPVDGGFVFILVYSSRSDWVRNVLAAGRAQLTIDGRDIAQTAPRLISGREAWGAIGAGVKRPPGVLQIDEHLRTDLVPDVENLGPAPSQG
jgi:deazaflavin-dependent oxidoreductase (nitroreductase family)